MQRFSLTCTVKTNKERESKNVTRRIKIYRGSVTVIIQRTYNTDCIRRVRDFANTFSGLLNFNKKTSTSAVFNLDILLMILSFVGGITRSGAVRLTKATRPSRAVLDINKQIDVAINKEEKVKREYLAMIESVPDHIDIHYVLTQHQLLVRTMHNLTAIFQRSQNVTVVDSNDVGEDVRANVTLVDMYASHNKYHTEIMNCKKSLRQCFSVYKCLIEKLDLLVKKMALIQERINIVILTRRRLAILKQEAGIFQTNTADSILFKQEHTIPFSSDSAIVLVFETISVMKRNNWLQKLAELDGSCSAIIKFVQHMDSICESEYSPPLRLAAVKAVQEWQELCVTNFELFQVQITAKQYTKSADDMHLVNIKKMRALAKKIKRHALYAANKAKKVVFNA